MALVFSLSPLSKTSSSSPPSSSSSMATTTTLLQHPSHDQHPLEPRDFSNDSITPICYFCYWRISADGYACKECEFYAHRACAEAPPQIDPHPLHPDHPLTLIHRRQPLFCDACDEYFDIFTNVFRCDECDFDLDVRCALSNLSDRGGTQGKTPEQIELPLHIHKLTSFSTRHDFIRERNCEICEASVEGDGYACLRRRCDFLIHKSCIQDLHYTDGTKAPRIYHRHPLKTFLGEDMGSTRCVNCRSDESSGEFIGCAECRGFYCRDCVQVPESIQYPRHPDHTLVLLIGSFDNNRSRCDSCFLSLEGELCYGCPSCEFFVDMICAFPVLSYSEEGMSADMRLSWHEHQLHLCHRTESYWSFCSYCEDKASGPMYVCKQKDCELLLHKRCIEIKSTIIHPHHPDHPLNLSDKDDFKRCEACSGNIDYLKFFCELCAFYLHAKCAAHVPTRKHSLHEHELLHLEKAPSWKCNRCDTILTSPFFRCVPCDFNLHEECMEVPPQVVNSKFHWHPLTLHETYIEDDSGEYYCDQCEKRRDERMGAYVCLQCPQRWVYHIECVLPELRKVCFKDNTIAIKRLIDEIARGEEEVREAERKLDEMKLELEEKRKKHAALIIIE